LVFLGAVTLAGRLTYPLTNSAVLQLSFMSVALAGAGALARLWSRHWSSVAVPAAAVSLVTVILLGMGVYLGDGGDPAFMWRYVPGMVGLVAALVMTTCALAGWAILGKVRAHSINA
jgi:hypothetical protein